MLLSFLSDFLLRLQSPELFLSDTTVVELEKMIKVAVLSKAFSFYYCQFRKNMFGNGSMEIAFSSLYCHFMLL